MSTGTGIYHSEYNAGKTEDAKFLQIWIIPNVEGTKPEYHNYDIRPLLKRNELATFISPSGNTPAHLLQDAWFSTMGTLDAGQSVTYRMHKPRTGVYIFIIEGEINIAGENLSRRDGIGIWDIESVTIEAKSEAQILAIEVAVSYIFVSQSSKRKICATNSSLLPCSIPIFLQILYTTRFTERDHSQQTGHLIK